MQMNVIVIAATITTEAHLGFVNCAVQRIVLLVILQTELQGPQCSCKDKEETRWREIRSWKRKVVTACKRPHWGEKESNAACSLKP